MALNLDTRQRAMLEEMHVRVWWPTEDGAAEPAVPTARTAAAAPAVPALPRLPPSAPVPPVVDAGMVAAPRDAPPPAPAPRAEPVDIPVATPGGWLAFQEEVAACNACGLCAGRKSPPPRPAADAPLRQRDWLVVGEPPGEAEERAGTAFVGEAGQLLDNMLHAVQVSRSAEGAAGAWATNVVQCRPAMARIPEPAELLRCRQHIDQQIALLQPKVILAMGRFATQSLLGPDNPALVGKPFGQLRGSVHAHAGVPVVVMQHPERLLRAPAQKAEAWVDLCRALEIVRGR